MHIQNIDTTQSLFYTKIASKVKMPEDEVRLFFASDMAPCISKYQGAKIPLEIPLGKYLADLSQLSDTSEVSI